MTGAVPREQQTIDERQILRQIVLAPCTVPAEDAFERCPPLWLGQAPLPVPQQHGNRPSAYFSHDPVFSHGDRLSLTQACKRCTSRYIHGHGPPPSLCIAPLLLSVIPQPRQLPLSCRGESGRHPGSAFNEQLRITHEGPSLNRWSCHDALGTRGWESSQDTRTPTNNILPLTNPTSLAN
jgi:hypothetical protein